MYVLRHRLASFALVNWQVDSLLVPQIPTNAGHPSKYSADRGIKSN